MSVGRVLGVDGCAAGWTGIAVGDSGIRALVDDDIAELVDAAGADEPIDVLAIDIPIDLPALCATCSGNQRIGGRPASYTAGSR